MNSCLFMFRFMSMLDARRQSGRMHPLLLTSLAIALLVGVPVAGVLSNLFSGPALSAGIGTFAHLWATVLPEYIVNSVLIAVIVAVLTAVLGIGCAWLVAAFDFPGRKFFAWALILPLAMPAYVVAYAYTDFLQYTGPLQTGLRAWAGWQGPTYWFPEIRSVSGAGFLFSFVLYP